MMASWMNNLRAFGSGSKRGGTQNQVPNRANTSSPSAYSPSSLAPPNVPLAPASPSLSATMTMNDQAHQNNQGGPKKQPFFFREEYAGFIVKGNFMTLAAKPHLVEEGEWMAHQIVEQNRILGGMLKCMQERDPHTQQPLCNKNTCPSMSAGSTTYTWIDTSGKPINLEAWKYVQNIQIWINGKVTDPNLFPTDSFITAPPVPRTNSSDATVADPNSWTGRTSGFPQRFEHEIKNMYKQMFRCYAHMYWSHWLQCWELNVTRELNTCFVHFINVGRVFGLLGEKDMEPMAPLIEIWVKQGALPKPEVKEGGAATPAAAQRE